MDVEDVEIQDPAGPATFNPPLVCLDIDSTGEEGKQVAVAIVLAAGATKEKN